MAKKKRDDSAALFIPAGVLLGMGFGFLFDNLVAGLFIGLGIGFFAFALLLTIKNYNK
ncbi:MAG: hypothetical protein ACMXX9_00245 [Candidatus Woesearchaeota archaeon]